MKYSTVLSLLAAANATTLKQLDPSDLQKRIPETPKPYLIPDVMKVDQDQKHQICNGTNEGHCREAEPYLRKEL